MGCENNHTKKIKFLFSNGSTERRVPTNTTDRKLAIKRKLPKCQEIYREFDKKQIDYLNEKAKQKRNKETWYDEEAKVCIINLA